MNQMLGSTFNNKLHRLFHLLRVALILVFPLWASGSTPSAQSFTQDPPFNEIPSPSGSLSIDGVIEPDERVRIEATTEFPWRAIADLDVHFPNGVGTCTGFFIGPRIVATAGHCIFNSAEGGWAISIKVMPGRNSSSLPYGSQIVSTASLHVPSQWVDLNNSGYDYGAIILPDAILGSQTGWFNLISLTDSDLTNRLFNIAGYPADKPDSACSIIPACQLWLDAESIGFVTDRIVSYAVDTYGGQSGSPVWYFDGGWYVAAIHTNGYESPICATGLNCGTRITDAVLREINTWAGVLQYDMYDAGGDGIVDPIPVSTNSLTQGAYFFVTISGTFSFWPPEEWNSVCAGTPEDEPYIPSPNTVNGKVGVDVEYIFAHPCANYTGLELPFNLTNFEISTDNQTTWVDPIPIESLYSGSHAYRYLVRGAGYPIAFRENDSPTNDNYGVLTIQIEGPLQTIFLPTVNK